MSDKPILFSAPMVHALLAGTKTQTRRIAGVPTIERVGDRGWFQVSNRYGGLLVSDANTEADAAKYAADYLPIQPGDRLYVREHWRTWDRLDGVAPRNMDAGISVQYEAGQEEPWPSLGTQAGRFRQGMHMPRWASRITLHVTESRVQRLQDISEEDALAEGVNFDPPNVFTVIDDSREAGYAGHTAVECYADLWNGINGADAWSLNPFVAAYTFEVEHCNIAEARK